MRRRKRKRRSRKQQWLGIQVLCYWRWALGMLEGGEALRPRRSRWWRGKTRTEGGQAFGHQ